MSRRPVVGRPVEPVRPSRVRGRLRGPAGESQSRAALRLLPGEPRELGREHVADVQRSRLLAGAAVAIQKDGFAATTVAHITGYAKVSRRTFYDLFEDREDCVLALVQDVLVLLEDELAQQELAGLAWRERIRTGLATILAFFDREPELARVCVVCALNGGPRLTRQREATLDRLVDAVDAARRETRRAKSCTRLTAEGVVGAVMAIVHSRLSHDEGEPLLGLVGELMGMIALPYMGAAAARKEQTRPVAKAAPPVAREAQARLSSDPLRGLGMRVTYRTVRALQVIAQNPGASNRQIADGAGIKDQGQVSKLLARLGCFGLVTNSGAGQIKGEPNAWTLTALGEQVTQRLGVHPNTNGPPDTGQPAADILAPGKQHTGARSARTGQQQSTSTRRSSR